MKLVLTSILETLVLASPKKAIEFAALVAGKIKLGNNVSIDFSGVKGITVNFLYIFFVKISKECGANFIKKICLVNATDEVIKSIDYLKENYKELNNQFSEISLCGV
ncbi:STAS-like domain-containing protein [Fusobacterium sp. PH5-44]|uniref:STAS-like domain-containing protein n=1 Tax=unclassified Fusobacterium TaxID=2648384 RepID=UPI003D19F197